MTPRELIEMLGAEGEPRWIVRAQPVIAPDLIEALRTASPDHLREIRSLLGITAPEHPTLAEIAGDKEEAQRRLSDDPIPAPGDVYEHYKGGIYTVVCQSIREDTYERLVTYRSNRKRSIWTRTHTNFSEPVKLENGWIVPRFRKVDR